MIALRVVAELCARGDARPPRVLVLEGAPSSGLDVVLAWLPFLRPARRALAARLAYGFDAAPAAAGAACVPLVFQFHGARDRTVPLGLGRAVHAALGRPDAVFVRVPRAGHEDAADHPRLRAKLRLFLKPAAAASP